MSTIKHTKDELKAQRGELERLERFLPTLRLKEQQLQQAVKQIDAKTRQCIGNFKSFEESLDRWVSLFSNGIEFREYLKLETIREKVGNIAGVEIPLLGEVIFGRTMPDLYATPAWLEDGVEALEHSIRLRLEINILREQSRRLRAELRATTQRVNLFEQVKIPTCRENIRVIRIHLADQQIAGIVRSKLAKRKNAHPEFIT